jgi:glutamate dehydrogenase/leucine dehydrogenase
MNVTIIPDILANAGGVIVSYLIATERLKDAVFAGGI